MENKPQNVFEKLDKQEEKIEDISSKLEGISISDLYALAKRTWDYEDYQTAQKYYNHISLLRPLDWEAPLYASLCNFKGPHEINYWYNGLERVSKVLVSTINYINNLNKLIDEKNEEMLKCVVIVKDFMLSMKNMYLKNRESFDSYTPDFVCKLEELYYEVFDKAMSIELGSLQVLRVFIADNILDLVKVTNKLSTIITEEEFKKINKFSSKDYSLDYKTISELNKVELAKVLSFEEEHEIKLNGIMYYEYNDKVISKRNYRRDLLGGISLMLLSIAGLVVSFFVIWYWMLFYGFSMICGILLIIKSLTQKDKIKCSSLLCSNRVKNRLTSNGTIAQDKKPSLIKIVSFIEMYLSLIVSIFMPINANTLDVSGLVLIFTIIISLLNIIFITVRIKIFNSEYQSKYDGKYSYLYEGKFYSIE